MKLIYLFPTVLDRENLPTPPLIRIGSTCVSNIGVANVTMLIYYVLPFIRIGQSKLLGMYERFHQEMNNGGSFCSHQFSKQRDVKVFLVPAEGLYYWGSKKHKTGRISAHPHP